MQTHTVDVFRSDDSATPRTGRIGTVTAAESDLVAALGVPVDPEESDGKVTKVWRFATPRGVIDLRDYWWNKPGEWSLSAENWRAAIWLRRHIRSLVPDVRFQFQPRHFQD